MNKVLVTGANGFIGQALCVELLSQGYDVVGSVRDIKNIQKINNVEYLESGNIEKKNNWKENLIGCKFIIHCAGKTSNLKNIKDSNSYTSINFDATIKLAEQAVNAGVKKIIFLSSIKVLGEVSGNELSKTNQKKKIFTNTDIPNPENSYAKSKYEAEKALLEMSKKNDLEIVILRLPIVYGLMAKGNLNRLIKLVRIGLPLPFALINNKRSMIGIDNLVNLIIRCLNKPEASGKTLLVSDGDDLSTKDLIYHISLALGKPMRLFPVPSFILKILGALLGKKDDMQKLLGTLQIDSSYTRKLLKWNPPVRVSDGIRSMVTGK